ncbi:MAG: YcbK family protein [Alphaproteobacteria bacterium]
MSDNSETLLSPSKLNMIDRREILKLGLAGTLASVVPLGLSSTSAHASARNTWRVGFRHAHTGESFNGVYRVGDKYLPEAFERLNYVLRDFRTGEVFPMDPRVIDIMALVQKKANVRGPMTIFSGYRSPKTNNRLRKNTSGVAKNSFHMYGQALDMHIDNYSTRNLCSIAKDLRAGGVGYYPKSQFVHVDTGSVRSW